MNKENEVTRAEIERLRSDLAATRQTLGTLISWMQTEIGAHGVKQLLTILANDD